MTEPFMVGDRVTTRIHSNTPVVSGEIVAIEGAVAIVRFDDLLHFGNPTIQELAWRIERLEHDAVDLGEEYSW